MAFNWADEMEEVTKKQEQERKSSAIPSKKTPKLEWIYVSRGEKKSKLKLVYRETNKRVDIVEKLFQYIMEARYGEAGVQRAARKKPREAILALEDHRAGRSTEDKARKAALEYLLVKMEAAMRDWKSRQRSAK